MKKIIFLITLMLLSTATFSQTKTITTKGVGTGMVKISNFLATDTVGKNKIYNIDYEIGWDARCEFYAGVSLHKVSGTVQGKIYIYSGYFSQAETLLDSIVIKPMIASDTIMYMDYHSDDRADALFTNYIRITWAPTTTTQRSRFNYVYASFKKLY